MATSSIFDVEFEVVRKNAGGTAGPVYAIRRGVRKATIKAASANQADILTVLNSDIAGLQNGEIIEVISVRPGQVSGSEGGLVLS